MKNKYIALFASVALVSLIVGCGGGEEEATTETQSEIMGSIDDSITTAMENLTAYPLEVCLISGEELGAMGDPIIASFSGQEFKLCCEDCVNEFDADPQGLFDKLMAMQTEEGVEMESVDHADHDHSEHE